MLKRSGYHELAAIRCRWPEPHASFVRALAQPAVDGRLPASQPYPDEQRAASPPVRLAAPAAISPATRRPAAEFGCLARAQC